LKASFFDVPNFFYFNLVRNNEDCYDLVEYLLEKEVNMGQVNKVEKTAIDYSIQLKDTRLIELLIDYAHDFNINKINYNRALIDIAIRGDCEKFHLVYDCASEQATKTDALEIIGAVLGENATNLPSSLMYWEMSLDEKRKMVHRCPKQSIQTAPYFVNKLKSKHELNAIGNDPIEFQMQSFLIRERALCKYKNIKNLSVFNVFKLLYFNNSSAKPRKFKPYLIKNFNKLSSLWLYGIGMQVKHLKPFHSSILENLFDFVSYLKYISQDVFSNSSCLNNYINIVLVKLLKLFLFEVKRSLCLIRLLNSDSIFAKSSLNNLINVLDKIDYDFRNELDESEIDNKVSENEREKENLHASSTDSDSKDDDYVYELEYINNNLNIALRVFVYLIEFSISNISKLEHNANIKSLIKYFVYLSKYTSSNSLKLFSLALSKNLLDNLNIVNKFKYEFKQQRSISFKFIRYLLSIGCDPDCLIDDYSAKNTFLNTGLFRVLKFSNKNSYDCDSYIKLFLSHSAHLDYTNDEGMSLAEIYKNKFDLDLNRLIRTTSFTSLKCLSARVILKHNIAYMNSIPLDLVKFISRH
jgi:hypothetical protein